jgi:hypothetical protein
MRRSVSIAASLTAAAALAAAAVAGPADAHSRFGGPEFQGSQSRLAPDSLLISGSVYPHQGVNITVGQNLPFVDTFATSTTPAVYAKAVADGQYPYVFNNASSDGSFGVATPISLWDVNAWGQPLSTIQVPSDQMTTSFSSKSELALNVSTDGHDISFLGYGAPTGTLDASNADTPGVRDATNPDVAGPYYRVAGALSTDGQWTFTDSNAYSGDNGRAAVLNNAEDDFYTAGNDNNGNSKPILPSLVNATGAQTFARSFLPQAEQDPGAPTQLATFSITQLGDAADKAGKDMNFRGLTIYNNVVYYTKGSGSNGVNTVYFVDTTGTACPTDGVGLPVPGAALPAPGVTYTLCVLKGFNTALAKSDTTHFPFGLWFANADTLYVADEGNGNFGTINPSEPYEDAQQEQDAGLQKWVFDTTTQQWKLDYVIQNGLSLGTPYTVPGYPTGDNGNGTDGTSGLPWAPATDGLRNIAGHVNGNGSVTIYATTSTVSGSGDQGADPNKVVSVTDWLGENTLPASEKFTTLRPATDGVVYRGVAWVPSEQFGGRGFRGFHDHRWAHRETVSLRR